MIAATARLLFGGPERRFMRDTEQQIANIGHFEAWARGVPDDGFHEITATLMGRFAAGETLDDLLPEAFALAREAAFRVLGMRPYDVQMMGGIVLHAGKVAEMRTGEGKTLVAVMPAFLNALSGWSVHIVTVNDYLARRDSTDMGAVFSFLGLRVGCVVPGMADDERRSAYSSDITYVTNAEIGFDYLRDNMKMTRDEMVHRPLNFAIVDEVDSILIDEARTPLVITGLGPDASLPVAMADASVARLKTTAFEIDERTRTVHLTERGLVELEVILEESGIMTPGGHLHDHDHLPFVPFMHAALRAKTMYHRDRDYIVNEGKVNIVDQHTGRVLEGRRFSDGLHQALEAKEGVAILPDNVTAASVTYQNFFRMYPKLAGMTGTAKTEEAEFGEIYGLDVIRIPTNRPVVRKDEEDEIYVKSVDRDAAVAAIVGAAHRRSQPVLVGTSSVERSEALSRIFDVAGIPHSVLNARHHTQEASIVAQAGRPGVVTISTNMAGRGTDIKLGGNAEMLLQQALPLDATQDDREALMAIIHDQVSADAEIVRKAGGLMVVGTERHESRRVDDQLRGRSGRQGDPGASRFLMSLEDDLMKRFGGEKLGSVVGRLGLEEGEAITHPWVTRSMLRAQQKVEAQNFEARKNLLKYDDVANKQRQVFYRQRMHIIDVGDISTVVEGMRDAAIAQIVRNAMPPNTYPEQWDRASLIAAIAGLLNMNLAVSDWMDEDGCDAEVVQSRILAAVRERDVLIHAFLPAEGLDDMRRQILLQCMDTGWNDHLAELDCLREGIHLRAFAQKNPLYEWHRETARLFAGMFDRAAERTVHALSRIVITSDAALPVGIPEEPKDDAHNFGEVVVHDRNWEAMSA